MHELPDLSELSVAQKETLILTLFEQKERLTATVQALSARVRELQGRLRKDSHNSSKPAVLGWVGQEARIAPIIQRAQTGRAGGA